MELNVDAVSVALATIAIALLAISIALIWIARLLSSLVSPTITQRLRVLEDRARFNISLLSEQNIEKLNRFADSEAALSAVVSERGEASTETVEAAHDNPPKGFIALVKKGWNKNKEWLKEKLVDKLNDVAKGAIGLSGKDK